MVTPSTVHCFKPKFKLVKFSQIDRNWFFFFFLIILCNFVDIGRLLSFFKIALLMSDAALFFIIFYKGSYILK